jgi:hypothetical protein
MGECHAAEVDLVRLILIFPQERREVAGVEVELFKLTVVEGNDLRD